MESADKFPLTEAACGQSFFEGISPSRLVLEHYDREHLPLRRYLVFIGLDSHTAEDIVQDTFLKLHEHLDKGGDQSHLRAWLFRVAHNLARNHQSSFSVSQTDLFADVSVAADPLASSASAEESLLLKERSATLVQAVRRLSRTQRDCLFLRSQGLKYREIADALGLTTSTVAENVGRALRRLEELT